MFTREQLSWDNGFQKGLLLEVGCDNKTYVGALDHMTEECLWFQASYFLGFELKNIQYLKVLSGPQSIWNHAPEWAKSVYVFEDGLSWKTTSKEDWISEWPELEGLMFNRPFWVDQK